MNKSTQKKSPNVDMDSANGELAVKQKEYFQQRIENLKDSLNRFQQIRQMAEGAVKEAKNRLESAKNDELACSIRLDETIRQLNLLESRDYQV